MLRLENESSTDPNSITDRHTRTTNEAPQLTTRAARQVRKSRREIPRNRAAEASSDPGGCTVPPNTNPMAHSNNGIEGSQLSIDRAHHLCEIHTVSSDDTEAGYVIKNHQQLKFLRHEDRSRRCRTVLHATLSSLA